jgi:hypothetical protein
MQFWFLTVSPKCFKLSKFPKDFLAISVMVLFYILVTRYEHKFSLRLLLDEPLLWRRRLEYFPLAIYC